ncbi:hypothetical protein HYC85_005136 [Camellia sinensis]|uniref:Uncharacterized protein n=1 Tax=Camellia sinensis TaxID=4442 RepID=A0A7J7I059_CAMSI|nr:hypothetical protein HYC85_005136 [Camellia sinensis]
MVMHLIMGLSRNPVTHESSCPADLVPNGSSQAQLHSIPIIVQLSLCLKDFLFLGCGLEVKWGKFNMVEAERRLLANALLDFSNQRFVLLSESCIPLFSFSTIYSYLMGSTKTFMDAYDLPGHNQYQSQLQPLIMREQWRKGS